MKKLVIKEISIINILVCCLQLTSCTGYKKYVAPNNHKYIEINEPAPFISNNSVQLSTNDRYAIPKISQEFKEPIQDFTPPYYANENFPNPSIEKSKLHKKSNNGSKRDNSIDNNNNNNNNNNKLHNENNNSNTNNINNTENHESNYAEDIDINLEETD